jgi:hypothetical protein
MLVLPSALHEQIVDLRLSPNPSVPPFSNAYPLAVGRREFQCSLIDQPVVEDHLGPFNRLFGSESQQIQIAWACSHQIDDSPL